MVNTTSNNFYEIVINELPLIDVRAPIEFNKGSFLNSVNLPIMNDEERHLVGICYKEKGNEEAVKLGHQLVSGDIKQARIDAWKSYLSQHPDIMIYCFRGGSRSQIAQQWITEETGRNILRLEGGYKAFRNYLIRALDPSEQNSIPIILGGCTGCGKTILLKKLKNYIDLEGIAQHRGSAFGQFITPQLSQISFENNLAYALIQHKHNGYRYMILEDEGSHIGKCFLPKPLFEHFNSGNLVILEIPIDNRINIIMDEYVIDSQANYLNKFGNTQGLLEWFNYMSNSISKIKKRLGSERYKRLSDLFEHAFKEQLRTGSYICHKDWIAILLKEYYDPMYNYQIKNTTKKIVYRGNAEEVLEYLKALE